MCVLHKYFNDRLILFPSSTEKTQTTLPFYGIRRPVQILHRLQLLFYSYLRQQSDDPLIALSPHVETNSDPSEVFCSVLEPVVTHISAWHLLTVLQDKSSSVLFHCSYYKILLVDLAGNDPASARHYLQPVLQILFTYHTTTAWHHQSILWHVLFRSVHDVDFYRLG